MKSKISFFNPCIYKKNVKLFWPIWLGYWIILMVLMPVRMWLSFKQIQDSILFYGQEYAEDYISTIYNAVNMDYHIIIITVFALACVACVFGYLFNARNANMMHAFPVNRFELFCTNVISGLSFLWVPQLICFFTTLVVCVSFGETRIVYLGIWLVMSMAISFFLFSVAVLSAMCTGHTLAIPVIFATFNLGYIAIRQAVTGVIEFFAFGVNNLSDLRAGKINWLSPLYYIFYNVQFSLVRDKAGEHIIGIDYIGMQVIASFFAIGILVYIIAYILYARRRIECAGDMIAFDIVKPVFRWGIGVAGSFFITLVSYGMISSNGIKISDIFFIVSAVIFGIIIFFITDMFIQKNFRVFARRRVRESIIYIGCFLIVTISLKMTGDIIEKALPDNKDVECAYISSTFPVRIDGDKINDVIALQNQIIKNEKYLRKVKSNYTRDIDIVYNMKNGKKIKRSYSVPLTDKSIKLVYEQIYKYESNAENMKKYLLCYDIDKCMANATGGTITVSCSKTEKTGHITLTEKQIAAVLQGFIKDIEEGNVQNLYAHDPAKLPLKKYDDGTYIVKENTEFEYVYRMDLSFVLNNFSDYMDSVLEMNLDSDSDGENYSYQYSQGKEYYGGNTSLYQKMLEKNFSIDENCKNTIQALIDAGIIKNINDLHKISERNV